jgi:hypothetical protein
MSLQEVADLPSDARSLRTAFVQREPDPESVATHDLDEAARAIGTAAPIERLIHCVDLWSVIASEELYGLSLMIRDGTSGFPIFPILRSIIEHAAWIAWVLDNDSSSRQRAARAALAVLRSQEAVMKLAGRMGDKKPPEYHRFGFTGRSCVST